MLRPSPLNLRPWRCVSALVAFMALWPRTSLADSSHECAEAYEKAQIEKKAGHISAAIEALTLCSGELCPRFIRKDCIQWMTESQDAQPSVVFSVRRKGVDVSSVEIACDGRVVARVADGKSVAIDPGPHVFVFRTPGARPVERRLIVREGERNRIVEADFEDVDRESSARALPRATVAQSADGEARASGPLGGEASRSRLSLRVYGFAGLGLLGVSGFTAFGLWGNSQKHDLESSCAPYCRSSQVDEVRTKYIVADTCLAVGVVSLGLATYWLVTGQAPSSSASDTSVAVSPSRSGRGGVLNVSTAF